MKRQHKSKMTGPTPDTRHRINSLERQALETLARYEGLSLGSAWCLALREALARRDLPNVGSFSEGAQ